MEKNEERGGGGGNRERSRMENKEQQIEKGIEHRKIAKTERERDRETEIRQIDRKRQREGETGKETEMQR